jgi:hypothetical protein
VQRRERNETALSVTMIVADFWQTAVIRVAASLGVSCGDGAVFAHLHPVGSISMAALEVLSRCQEDPATRGMPGMDHAAMGHGAMDHSTHGIKPGAQGAASLHRIAFPFEFPRTGPYRIWVQVKVGDEVLTGVFDTEVTDAEVN